MLDKSMEHVNATDVKKNLMLMCKSNEPNEKYTNTWYLDIGCNNHMSGKNEFFSHLDKSIHREFNLGINQNSL